MKFMGENQPLVRFVNKIVRWHVSFPLGGLVVNCCDLDDVGGVAAALLTKFAQDGIDAKTGIKNIINDEEFVVGTDVVDNIAQAMDPHFGTALGDAAVGRGSDGNVVGLDAHVIHIFLDCDTDGRAAAPDANDVIGFKSALQDFVRKTEGIVEQAIGINVEFIHAGVSFFAFWVGDYISFWYR